MERPDCTKAKSMLEYTIVDQDGKTVPVTVAGYRLRPDHLYELRVNTLNASLAIERVSLQESNTVELAAGELSTGQHKKRFRARCETNSFFSFVKGIDHIPVGVTIAGNPHELRIPIVLMDKWTLWTVLAGVTGIFGLLVTLASALITVVLSLIHTNLSISLFRITLAALVVFLLLGIFSATTIWWHRQLRIRAENVRKGVFLEAVDESGN